MGKTFNRRNFFIKKEMQGKYILSFFVFIIFSSVLYASIFSWLSADSFTIVYKDSNLTIGKTPSVLFVDMLRANWILILVGGVAGVIIAMFLTHRFAGPIYKLEKSIYEMSGGNLAFDVHLRKSDEGKELAAALNGFKDGLAGRISSMREISDAIDINLKRTMDYDPAMQEQARSLLDETRSLNEKLRKTLDEYTIKKP
jgi:methyl-accepting chemotaxis protein